MKRLLFAQYKACAEHAYNEPGQILEDFMEFMVDVKRLIVVVC